MQITLSVRHAVVSDSIKQYAQNEINGLSKFFDRLVEADITLDRQGHRHIAEVRIHSSNDTHFASSENGDLRTAIDETVKKLRRQLKRHKEKLEGRTLPREDRERQFVEQSRGEGEGPDPSVAPVNWPRISSAEAIKRLAATAEEILVFVDSVDGTPKIARRDEGGSIDVVEAETFEVEEG